MNARAHTFEPREKGSPRLSNREKSQIARIRLTLQHRGFGDFMTESAAAHHTTIEETLGRGRGPCAVRARWALWRLMSDAGLSSVEIGRLTERDHTTILAALKGGKRGGP